MKIDFLTLFPEMFSAMNCSIIGRAIENNIVVLNTVNIRDFSLDKHKKVDDYVFGGGQGLLMAPQPLFDAIESVKTANSYVVYVTPSGEPFTQKIAKELKEKEHLIFVCGHYEGIDQRVIDEHVDREISIGDYVLTNGELPAMVIADAVIRLLPNVLHNEDSATNDSFENNLLEHPQYTRPANFRGLEVPEVLLSGNHQLVDKWKREKQIEKTRKIRPDLLERSEK